MPTTIFGDEATAPAQSGRTTVFGDPVHDSTPGYVRLAAAGKYTDTEAPQPSPLEQIGHSLKSQFLGLVDLIGAEKDAARGDNKRLEAKVLALANHVTTNWKQATEAYHKGDYSGALAAAGRSIPVAGDLIDKASTDIVEGRPYEAATDTLAVPLIAKGAGLVADAAAGAPGAAVRAATAEAGAQVRPVFNGVSITRPLSNLPLAYDATAAIVKAGKQGAKDYVTRQDLAARAAANAGKAPIWQGVQPEVRPVPGQPVPLPSALPSGKVPGGPQNIPATPVPLPPRVPAWQQIKQSMEVAPAADTPIDPPNALPSGRVPGGVHNQELPVEQQLAPPEVSPAALDSPVDKFRELQKSAKAAKAPDLSAADQLLDGIAQGYGFKKGFKAVKDPVVQQTIRDLAAKVAEPKPTMPGQPTDIYGYDPAKDPSAFGQQLAKALDRLKQTGPLKTAPGPNDGPYRFEEGSGEAPIIDSSKTRGNGPVANPGMLKPGQPEAMADSLQKLVNPTEGQKALLKQLREEIKKRGAR